MYVKYLPICLSVLLISACNQKSNDSDRKTAASANVAAQNEVSNSTAAQTETTKQSSDKGEEWLKNVFKNNNSDKYFPEYNVEEKLCTKQFQEFIAESGELYGPSNLTDEKYPAAEKKYKEKWSKIYPIEEREMWLFGRGNGDIGELLQLEIHKVKDGLYRVFIDYGGGFKTENEVTLVRDNGNYKIDYCKTVFVD